MSECSDLIPDIEYLSGHEPTPPGEQVYHQRRPRSEQAAVPSPHRLELGPLPLQRSKSNVTVSRGPEGTLELSIPLSVGGGGGGAGERAPSRHDDEFSKAIRDATQAFEKSLVEAADNFSRNLAAMKGYEYDDDEDEVDRRRVGADPPMGLKRSYSEHYLPVVSVPDFAEVAFDAIKRAQQMRQIEDRTARRSSYLDSISNEERAERRKRSHELSLQQPRRIEAADLPSAYRPSIGYRARSVGPDILHSSLAVQKAK